MGLWGFMFDFLGPQDFHGSPAWESLEMVNSHRFQYWKKNIHWFQGITMIQGDLPLWERTIYVCLDVFGMNIHNYQRFPDHVFIHWNHTSGHTLSAFGYVQKTYVAKWPPPKSHGIANNMFILRIISWSKKSEFFLREDHVVPFFGGSNMIFPMRLDQDCGRPHGPRGRLGTALERRLAAWRRDTMAFMAFFRKVCVCVFFFNGIL